MVLLHNCQSLLYVVVYGSLCFYFSYKQQTMTNRVWKQTTYKISEFSQMREISTETAEKMLLARIKTDPIRRISICTVLHATS